MQNMLPDFLVQGEVARLFPVLSETSKEGRTTSILLACISKIDELGRDLLSSAGQRLGNRAQISTYTEIVLSNQENDRKNRPDGIIVLKVGSREWRALVEAKIGNNQLDARQIEKYRNIAKDSCIDCVITISNQFTSDSRHHPLHEVRKSRCKVPVIHWSWMHILTTVDILINREDVKDKDQLIMLNELRRFLSHDSAGVRGFDRMPKEWTELNRLVASGGEISAKSNEAKAVIEAWHQETRDLSLILSRMTETRVEQRLTRQQMADPAIRIKDELDLLCDRSQLRVSLVVAAAAAPIDVIVDLKRHTVDVGMRLRAPEDKKSTKARLNWLLRQIKEDIVEDLYIRIYWPGRSSQTQHLVSTLRSDIDCASEGKEKLAPTSFHIFECRALGGRFAQQANFIDDLESIVPSFYRKYGSVLSAWQKPAPKIKEGRDDPEDVSTEAISSESESFGSPTYQPVTQ